MAQRNPEAKRRQLLAAGLAEFAAHGIAGARIDRIAERAGCSAGLVYTYFGNKEELFEAVYRMVVVETVSTMPLTPDDLPGYAGRLYDGQVAYPDVMRLATWYRLERVGTGSTIQAVIDANKDKVDAIRTAQLAGTVSDRFDAVQLLLLVLHIASMWSSQSEEVDAIAPTDHDYRRTTVMRAVRELVTP